MPGVRKFLNSIESAKDSRIALFFLVTAFLLRGTYAVLYFLLKPEPETNLYYELGIQILEQGKIFYQTSHPYYDFPGPVLPWLNALTMLVFGRSYLGLYIVTALGSALVTYYTYKTARLFLHKTESFVISTWSLVYLFYFYYTPSPGKDIWMSFFLIYLIFEIIRLFRNDQFSYFRYSIFILMLSISTQLDERFLVFVPMAGVYILLRETNQLKKLRLKKTLVFVLLFAIFLVPWSIRNYLKYDKIVIISNRTEIFTDKVFGYEYEGHMMDEFNDIRGKFFIHEYQIDSIIQGEKKETDGGWKIREPQRSAMENGLRPEPLTGLEAVGSRLLTMFEPMQLRGRFERTGYYYYKKSLKHNIVTFLFYGIMFLFSFPAFFFLFQKDRTIFTVMLSVILVYALIHALSIPYTNWRYRLPLDTIFIITGWFGIFRVFERLKIG